MNPQAPQHQRVRFRREDIVDLDALPSAQEGTARRIMAHPDRLRSRRSGRHRLLRWLGATVGLAMMLALLLAFAIFLIGATGIGKEKLREAAERALERAAGRDIATTIGGTHISLDGSRLVGLEVSDVGLQAVGQPRLFARASSLRFGIELVPLLSGRVVLSSATLSGVSFDAGAFGRSGGGDWLAALRRGDGLVAPERLAPFVFGALQRTFVALERDFSGKVEMSDVSIVLPVGKSAHGLNIASVEAESSDGAALTLSAEGTLDGRAWSLSGVSERDTASGRVTLLNLDLLVSEGSEAARQDASLRLGSLRATLTGKQGEAGAPSQLNLKASSAGSSFDLKNNRGAVSGDGDIALRMDESPVVRIDRLRLSDTRSAIELRGTLQPRAAGPDTEAAYAFDLSGDELVLASSDAPEPPFSFAAKLNGSFEPVSRRLRAEALDLSSGSGSVTGRAGLQPVEGKSSGIDLALAVSALPVAQVKQLWPWFAARGARSWVLNHVAGGTVEEGRIDYHVAPGRIGNGTPPTPEELSGTFTVTGTRFDTAGQIPPVLDADGIVSFKGTDADIAVSTARMVLPSGQTLASGGGALALRAFNRAPLIGRLDVDVKGDAAGAAELASLEPINALRNLPFGAGDLGGPVEGHVSADIPFSRDVPRERLDFAASLAFSKLSIAKPIEGQTVRDAEGTLKVDPQKAVIHAAAKLNGAPAKLDFTEPLKADGPERSRKIALNLDDKARNALAPGLSTLLAGSTVLEIDASKPERAVRADLTQAKLSAPWVGWSKGAGVPAKASFSMTQNGGKTAISDLELSGTTFRVAGSVALDAEGMVSASFPSVRLNRDDQLAVSVRRDGKGFDVSVRGDSYDARALVKAATSQSEGAASEAGASGDAGSVSLKAEVQSVSGFGGEALKRVSVAYRSGGKRGRLLTIDGLTDTGAAVAIGDDTQGGQRQLTLQTADAGSLLRFLNIYGNMRGGKIDVALAGPADGLLTGELNARSFSLINEPRLGSLVSSRGDGSTRSLGEAMNRDIDTSRVHFDRASADLVKGRESLSITNGVLRGTTIGSTFQGTIYDEKGRMDMTGTFMPAYGLNRLFGELPLIGLILGNGNDRGLIGVTFKLQGSATSPSVTVNPLSVIAPGIFRQVFEYD